jgi:uncharacterized membrane protein YeaQ/YmgE (transglycosylase-associated protein family)
MTAMSINMLVLWIVIGLISGWLASAVVGGGYGLIGDIVIGVVGAFLGGMLFRALGIHTHLSGLPATILVAFVGAMLLLIILRLFHRGLAP